ncbi:receptor-type tyrosine-protein phosphatase epsilon-like, partial [Pecten maximus]|uniref:receptor-type tyrosine-protein phosphatase epsilon-like n=1 Tax=Pecten maximus TaxID=6579 RepID=UPI001458593A
GCQQYCYCLGETCDPQTGICPDSRCQLGWNGSACNQTCGPRTFGNNCVETCHCRQGSCHPANGTCLYEGCLPGWQTESCSEECDKGRFGHECSVTCGACRDNVPCDHVTGICPNGCADGWTKPSCNETCPTGTFGFNCTRKCFCKNGTCDPASGSCPDSDCDKGWRSPTCSLQCEAGFYGYNCEKACQCRIGSCNRTTGLCPPGGCKDGWQTDTCSEKCDRGSYGTNCSGTCGNCTDNGSCHPINGHCTQGCDPGFHGEQCHKECDDFSYGSNCQSKCNGCHLGKCQHVHGACLRGCISGMSGELCDKHVTEDDSMMMTTIGAVLGILFLFITVGLIVAILLHYRKRTRSAERSVEFHRTDDAVYCNIASPTEENLNEDETKMLRNGDIKHENDKAIYEVINDEENIYKNIDDEISVRSMASNLSKDQDETDEDISDNLDQSDNLYTNYAVNSGTQINVSKLTETIAFKKESGAFVDEYSKLPKGLQHPHESGKGPEKKVKNRFKDMFPYDHSRVVLNTLPGVDNSDYINGNYINSVSEERQYIGTQGPKEATVWDFWRMIWEQNSGKIVMITNIKEGKKVKCHRYWPPLGGMMSNDQLSVVLTDEKQYLAFVSRTLSVIDKNTEEKRKVYQFHFITWPDHGVPNPFQLAQFQRSVEKQKTNLPGPLVVHCSAGIGRTGTYIGLDSLRKHAQTSPTIDVYLYTLKMRENRLNMIQTEEQYIALHDALDVSLTFPDTSVLKSEFGEMGQGVRNNRIQDEFEALCKIKPTFVAKDFSIALSDENVWKNRSKDFIPANRFRVRLKTPLEGRKDYINAVYLPSCSRSCGFQTTQLPLADTVPDFWTMVYDNNSQIVVLLDREETDAQFLPTADEPVLEIVGFTVSIVDTNETMEEAEEIQVYIQKQDQKRKLVKVLKAPISSDHTDHIATHKLVNAVTSTIRLGMSHKDTIFTVVCSDGKTNCAPFCLLKAVIERMDLDGTIDIFNAAREIQNRQPHAFNTLGDIRIAYQALEEYIHSTSIYSNE